MSKSIAELSLTATFDDMCRFSHHNDEDRSDNTAIELLNLVNDLRSQNNELLQLVNVQEKEIKNLSNDKQHQLKRIETLRYSLQRETDLKESFKKKCDILKNKLDVVRRLIVEDPVLNKETPEKKKLFNALELRHLTVIEENQTDTECSLSDLDYDKSEEDIIEAVKKSCDINDVRVTDVADTSFFNVTVTHDNSPPAKSPVPRNEPPQPKVCTPTVPRIISSTSLASSRFSNATTRRTSVTSVRSSRVNDDLERRAHDFASKRAIGGLSRTKCNVCSSSFKMLSQVYHCLVCLATVHPDCTTRLPLPCVAKVTPSTSNSKYVTITKFCPMERPRVPAILLHCIKEIESRGKEMIFAYSKEASESESKKILDTLLGHKHGIPSLKQYTTGQLCGVVRSFLRKLDEPLITHILWSDFSRVVEKSEEVERITMLEKVVDQLPATNRDTLAFVMRHLQNVLNSGATISSTSLKRYFAPFVVGNSRRGLNSAELERQRDTQMAIMSLLLEDYTFSWNGGWDKVLQFDSCNESVRESQESSDDQTTVIANAELKTPNFDHKLTRSKLCIKPLF